MGRHGWEEERGRECRRRQAARSLLEPLPFIRQLMKR